MIQFYKRQCEKFYGKLNTLDENDIEMKILIQYYQNVVNCSLKSRIKENYDMQKELKNDIF